MVTRIPRLVVVMGLMGSGKSSVGQRLAKRLGRAFDDSDASIEARYGRSVKQLREELGTDAMHGIEVEHLLDALAKPDRAVIAPAAFVVEDPGSFEALRADGVVVVWLRAGPDVLARRFEDQAHRPWYGNDPKTFLAEQARLRDPLFDEVASIVIDVDDATIEDAARAAELALRGAEPG